jgi:hypothetical protein
MALPFGDFGTLGAGVPVIYLVRIVSSGKAIAAKCSACGFAGESYTRTKKEGRQYLRIEYGKSFPELA